jgi:hypothetical protein
MRVGYFPAIVGSHENYSVTIDKAEYGLWPQYRHDLDLFSLVTRTVALVFAYEPGFETIPVRRRTMEVTGEESILKVLNGTLKGVPVREIIQTTTPMGMLQYSDDLLETDLVDIYPTGNPTKCKEALSYALLLRAYQWSKYYRGVLPSTGGITQLQFKSGLSPSQEEELVAGKLTLLKIMEGGVHG